MTPQLQLALAQHNFIVGDIAGNCQKLMSSWHQARAQQVDLVIASELCVSGYPIEDMALRPAFLADVKAAVLHLAEQTADGPALLVGAPWEAEGKLYNAALLLSGGEIAAVTCKHDLPNYGCFDEKRTFVPGPLPRPLALRGTKLGVMICEDMWRPEVSQQLAVQGAELLIVINGSPFTATKQVQRLSLARERVTATGLPLIYVNQIGGQDELVFDGAGFALQADGAVELQQPDWREDVAVLNWHPAQRSFSGGNVTTLTQGPEALYRAIQIGLRDYVSKSGFGSVLLGLSGGIDSALVAVLAVDALGADKVHAVMLPSPYTAAESLHDAAQLANNLGIRLDTVPIALAMTVFDQLLQPVFAGRAADVTEENIQSRCRGLILMALSNKLGSMVLATGNKSEMAVGYATLYGDMCGGYAPLKDLYKTKVYELARWRNTQGSVIPENILTRAPTAELKPNQTDQDSLPPYDILDGVLAGLIESDSSFTELVQQGYELATIERVWCMLLRAEYKRRQAPPGPKLTNSQLTKDRRYPIINRAD
jgi:NAD+ synthase